MNSSTRNIIILVVLVVVAAAAYAVMTRPDNRSATDRIGDAIHELPNGPDKAVHELGSDRTPGEKLGDAVRDTGDKIKENSAPQ